MPEYQVVWEMTVWADDAHMAAEIARKHQRDPTAMVGVFDVTIPDGTTLRIDLDDEDDGGPCPDCGEDGGTKCGAVGCPY